MVSQEAFKDDSHSVLKRIKSFPCKARDANKWRCVSSIQFFSPSAIQKLATGGGGDSWCSVRPVQNCKVKHFSPSELSKEATFAFWFNYAFSGKSLLRKMRAICAIKNWRYYLRMLNKNEDVNKEVYLRVFSKWICAKFKKEELIFS